MDPRLTGLSHYSLDSSHVSISPQIRLSFSTFVDISSEGRRLGLNRRAEIGNVDDEPEGVRKISGIVVDVNIQTSMYCNQDIVKKGENLQLERLRRNRWTVSCHVADPSDGPSRRSTKDNRRLHRGICCVGVSLRTPRGDTANHKSVPQLMWDVRRWFAFRALAPQTGQTSRCWGSLGPKRYPENTKTRWDSQTSAC